VSVRHRIEVLHGVNFDQLGRRDPERYGGLDLAQLERHISGYGDELNLVISFFQTNHEGDYVERLHRCADIADGVVLNPGAWTHYAWALHDALEFAGVPAVEVHLTDIHDREPWRQLSVIAPLCLQTISGRGVEGYREALETLKRSLER
jgi:3-dehydroquinate dehydratase II